MNYEKKRPNRDERMKRKFFRNLYRLCAKTCYFDKDKSQVQSVVDSMAANKKFNPILCWKYTPVTACEVVMEEADYGSVTTVCSRAAVS